MNFIYEENNFYLNLRYIFPMDKSYSLIRSSNKKIIELYYFNYYIKNIGGLKNLFYPICFTALNSCSIFHLVSLHCHFNEISTEHKLYLGREIFKAEIAIKLYQQYIQN